jgi:hypothetical protein
MDVSASTASLTMKGWDWKGDVHTDPYLAIPVCVAERYEADSRSLERVLYWRGWGGGTSFEAGRYEVGRRVVVM